jgi:hypothetical protein
LREEVAICAQKAELSSVAIGAGPAACGIANTAMLSCAADA